MLVFPSEPDVADVCHWLDADEFGPAGWYDANDFEVDVEPSHWMPLPPAPPEPDLEAGRCGIELFGGARCELPKPCRLHDRRVDPNDTTTAPPEAREERTDPKERR